MPSGATLISRLAHVGYPCMPIIDSPQKQSMITTSHMENLQVDVIESVKPYVLYLLYTFYIYPMSFKYEDHSVAILYGELEVAASPYVAHARSGSASPGDE